MGTQPPVFSGVGPAASDWPPVCAIILNYATWAYTQACLASLVEMAYPGLTVVVVDNCSPNDSVARLADYLAAQADRQGTTSAGDAGAVRQYYWKTTTLVLLESPVNDGYAAGINVGLTWGLAHTGAAYFWVLNNDTTFHPDAIRALVRHHRQSAEPLGLLGSVLMEYDRPTVVQAVGSRYVSWLGVSFPVGAGETNPKALAAKTLRANYVIGAACFVERQTLTRIGLMPDGYFLYFEDIAWSQEAGRRGFTNAHCLHSLVYHREGGSTREPARRLSERIEFYFARNKIRFTKRYFPYHLPLVVLGAAGALFSRVVVGNFPAARTIWLATWRELLRRESAVVSRLDATP